MNIAERHKLILDKLQAEGAVSVADLSKELDVTMVTIRKDLQLLEDKGLLHRSHGSATLSSPYVKEKPVGEKRMLRVEEKTAMGRLAASLLKEEEAIILGSGTSVLSLAKAIPHDHKLTILTAAIDVTEALLSHPNIELVQLGGVVRKSSSSAVGHYAEEMLENFSCTKLILGVDGISHEFGLTTSNMMEAHLNAKMIRRVQKIIVLADSGKFGKKGFGKICDIDAVDLIVTDAGIADRDVRQLKERGIEVLIA